jgi:RHS repeat-associated protein
LNDAANPFRYTAREFDTETSLYSYRARYYDSQTGRFISEDPVRFEGGYNFYAYVFNNPANLNDPFGLCPQPGNPCPPSGNAPPPGFYWQLGQSANLFSLDGYLLGFRRGGFLDAQVLYGGTQAYANYVFGVFMGAAGFSLSATLNFANTYGALRSRYPAGGLDPNYTHIPTANVSNITKGLNDARNGTLCNLN